MIATPTKPNPAKPYISPLHITDEMRQLSARREFRAKELGISLYVLGIDDEKPTELQKLEDYIVDNFIDMDLDVPEDIKAKYLSLKQESQQMNSVNS